MSCIQTFSGGAAVGVKNINQWDEKDVKSIKITDNIKDLPFMDPTIKWYVRPSLNHLKIIRGNTPAQNSIQYSCDDAICVPRYYGARMKWYDPSTNSYGNDMFNLIEAWDHDNRQSPTTSAPYDGKAAIVPGYGGHFLAVPLTDKTNKVQVNIIRRYIDDTILIYNTGKYGNTTTNISIIVYDPPSGLGYNVDTNGTRGTGQTTLAPGQYVLFYKTTKPAVDATTGLFQTSPFGVNKSQPYELWVNSFTWYKDANTPTFTIPKMYLGVKAPGYDMEVMSNGSYVGVNSAYIKSGTSGNFPLVMIGLGGQDERRGYNVSRIIDGYGPWGGPYKDDPNTISWAAGNMIFGAWFGWGEDDAGNVKFIVSSLFVISVDTNFTEKYKGYNAYIYDVDRGEGYYTGILKPTVNTYSYGEAGATSAPEFSKIEPGDPTNLTAFAFIDANDNWSGRITDAAGGTAWTYHDNAYGFCNIYTDRINCAEGLGIYSDDPNYTPPAPKSAFGAARWTGWVGAIFPRVPSLGDRTLAAGRIYAVVTRLKTFPATATDTDLQNWFKALQPKALTSTDYNAMLSVLPGSFWLFGQNTDTQSITVPASVNPGSQFTVSISNSAKPNTQAWVAIIDKNGNIVASASGNTDASGNASITLTAPTTAGKYKVRAIVKGDRRLIE